MPTPLQSPHAPSDPGDARPPTDLETIRERQDLQVVPLKRNDRRFLAGLPALGRVAATTANSSVTCTQWGQAASVATLEGGDVVFDQRGGLRWFGDAWRHSVAVVQNGDQGRAPGLLLFSEFGELVHRIALDGLEAWETFVSLVKQSQGCMNCLKHPAAPAGPAEPVSGSHRLIREAWREAQSARDLDTRLEKLGLDRLQMVQALDGLCTAPVTFAAFAALLDQVSALRLSVHIQVGNPGCVQFLETTLDRVERTGEFWKLYATDVALRIEPGLLDSVWTVVQGGQSRVECYDGAGMRVLSLSCPAMADAWRRLLTEPQEG